MNPHIMCGFISDLRPLSAAHREKCCRSCIDSESAATSAAAATSVDANNNSLTYCRPIISSARRCTDDLLACSTCDSLASQHSFILLNDRREILLSLKAD